MLVVEICETYGWTYQEYLQQPNWFIDLVEHKRNIDVKKSKKKSKPPK